MIIFCGSQAQISAKEKRFAPKISSDIRSAAGELFIGPNQSLPEMSDGHWGTLYLSLRLGLLLQLMVPSLLSVNLW